MIWSKIDLSRAYTQILVEDISKEILIYILAHQGFI